MREPLLQATLAGLGASGQEACQHVTQVLDRVGDKWTIMVIGALAEGPLRFNALMRSIDGVSHRMLTVTLRSLERDGLLLRTAYPTVPPKVEYELTPLGRSLIAPLWTLVGWVSAHLDELAAARAEFDQR